MQIPPGRYEIDTQASTVTFKGRHLFGLAPVRGTFTSGGLERPGDRPTLAGTLTVRDVARPVGLVIEQATLQPASPQSLIVLASTRIDRTQFGLTAAPGLAGRHLDVSLRIQAVRR